MKLNLNQELEAFGISGLRIDTILNTAMRRGGFLAELFFEETTSNRLLFEGGRIDKIMTGTDRGVGLRIIFKGRSVYGYTTDLTETALLNLATTLSEAVHPDPGARSSDYQIEWGMAKQPLAEISQYHIAKPPHEMPISGKIDLVKRAEAAARAELPESRQVTSVFLDSRRKILILNSDGSAANDTKTYLQMMVQVVGERNGRVETAYESDGGYVGLEFLDQVTPESIGRKAAQRVSILLRAKPAPAGTMPVVISSDAGGTMIHEAVGHGLEADLACNGLSVY
ncbi:MAG: TldD/PmbA family protein, partial [Bdellovibrionia bacterium]